MTDYHKAAAIIIQNKKLLLTREKNKAFFISPGGVIENGETPEQALVRELDEEIGVEVNKNDLEFFGTFYAVAAGSENKTLQMDTYLVNKWLGEPHPCEGEEIIEEIRWLDSKIPENIKIGSIFEHEVIPRLKKMDLID